MPNKDDDRIRALFVHRTLGTGPGAILCGALCHYSPRHNQAVVAPSDVAMEWTVAQVRPPDLDDKSKTEWVESFFFFACKGDHLAVAQSLGFTAHQFEDYLDYLLRLRTKVLPGTQVLSLVDAASQRLREKGVPAVKAVRIGVPLSTAIEIPAPEGAKRKKPVIKRVVDDARVAKMLEFLSSAGVGLAPESVEKSGAEELEAVFELRFRPYKRFEDNALLNDIGSTFADAEESDYNVILSDGTELKSGELRVQKYVDVETEAGVPKPHSMFVALCEYLGHVFQAGLVDP